MPTDVRGRWRGGTSNSNHDPPFSTGEMGGKLCNPGVYSGSTSNHDPPFSTGETAEKLT
jgi:hypothetical protein